MNEDVDWSRVCAGCGECCGPVPFPIKFLEDNKDKMQLFEVKYIRSSKPGHYTPLSSDGLCVFLDRETRLCQVYEHRPDVCRLYGTIPDLPCPKLNPTLHAKVDRQIKNLLEPANKKL